MKKLTLSISFFLLSLIYIGAQVNVTVDFDKWTDFPLSKTKIGVYQTPLVTEGWLRRDIPKLSELGTRSMRYEVAWGKADCYGYEMTTRDKDGNLQYNFDKIDLFCDMVDENYANLVMCHSYCPTVAGKAWKKPPENYDVFKEVNKQFAKHWKDKRFQNHYIEVWNEPDLDIFFSGTLEDYLKIYESAAQGIIEGNPEAKVGGPAGAFQGFFTPLLEKCKTDNLPLHFLSGHNYGDPRGQLQVMRNALNQANRPDVEILMTEFAPYNTGNGDTHAGGLVEKAEAAMTFFESVETFLQYPDLTNVHWAQYIDAGVNGQTLPAGRGDKMGLIDGDNGKRKALFNGFKIYGMMPVDRYSLVSDAGHIKGFASADPNNAGVVVWNTNDQSSTLQVSIKNLPFQSGKAELYRIDEEHSWYETGEDGLDILQTFDIVNNGFSWNGQIPGKAVVFLKFTDLSGNSLLAANPFAHVVKTNHWFFNRDEPVYADFDYKTWITRLGMGTTNYGDAVIGVEAESIPKKFNVGFVLGGNDPRTIDANSTINFRMDYQSNSGAYTKSVLFHGDIHNAGRDSKITWGTKNHADQLVKVDLSNFDIEPAVYAPSDWNGKVIITYQIQNTGRGTRSKVLVKTIEPNDVVQQVSPEKELNIYPNPCRDYVTIEFPVNRDNTTNIACYNMLGKLVAQENNITSSPVQMNLAHLPQGYYMLSVNRGEGAITGKLLKQ